MSGRGSFVSVLDCISDIDFCGSVWGVSYCPTGTITHSIRDPFPVSFDQFRKHLKPPTLSARTLTQVGSASDLSGAM